MKRSLIICAVICIVAALLGWRESKQLSSIKEANARLVREAAAITNDDASLSRAASLRMAQSKEGLAMNEKVKALASDYFALVRNEGGASAEELAILRENIKSRLEELDPLAIREFMGEFNSIPDVNSGMKSDLNEYVMNVFIKKYPVEMAGMMSKTPELFSISNQPHKPWAVNVLLPDGRGFFPDFLVGVKDSKTPDGVLLAEPKFHFERRDEAPKADVAHATYGKVLVLHREGGVEWKVVRLDGKSQRPSLGDKLRIADLAGWGL